MTKDIENDKKSKDLELNENQIFEKIKEDLNPIQENLSEKKITIDEAKDELKKIDKWIKWTNLEKKDKQEIWKAFDKLKKNIDENTLRNEVNEIIKILENLTKRSLDNLKKDIQTIDHQNNKRPADVQEWLEKAANDLTETIKDASQDQNPIARKIGQWMKRLMS